MDFSLVYLVRRFFYRFFDFFHHWFVDGSRWFGHRYMNMLTSLDKTFAVRVTFEHFFEPLYGDYSIIGRILGAIFRTFRMLIGSVIYLFISILWALVYLLWLTIPIFVILKIIHG